MEDPIVMRSADLTHENGPQDLCHSPKGVDARQALPSGFLLLVLAAISLVAPFSHAEASPPQIDNVNAAAGTVGQPLTPPSGDYAVVRVYESAQGGQDLNGDGDLFDCVLHVYDFRSQQLTNLGLALLDQALFDSPFASCLVWEFKQGKQI